MKNAVPTTAIQPSVRPLTSRERVLRTLARESVDRTPIDLGGMNCSSISAFAYWNLREHLGLSTDQIEIQDTWQFLARVDEDLRNRFHVDTVYLQPPWPQTTVWNPRDNYRFHIPTGMNPQRQATGDWLVKCQGKEMRMPANGFNFQGPNCYADACSENDAFRAMAKEAERLFHESEAAVINPFIGSFFGGIEQSVQMLLEPETVLAQTREYCDQVIQRFDKINEAYGRFIQMIAIGNDMGSQQAPLCRPEFIDRYCGDAYRRLCHHIHENSDIKVFMHNCGAIRDLIPMFIDWGVDVLNPIQISAHGMDPAKLKAEFGDSIIFWGGGCDTQNVLGIQRPDDVANHVRELIRIFKPGGGFVFNQVHNIQGNVPPENIVALFDTAYACLSAQP